MSRNLLLISNSTLHGSGYLDHCATDINAFLPARVKEVLFIPYARPSGRTHDEYTELARDRFLEMGIRLSGIQQHVSAHQAVVESEAIFIGGGNTFRLLKTLYNADIMKVIRKRVAEGMLYIGASAGSNVACATIQTTNDMPTPEELPPSIKALGLVSEFILNPHYQDKIEIPDKVRERFNRLIETDPGLASLAILNHYLDHQGETRETRISEYFAFGNQLPVVGLREGAMLRIEDDQVHLRGSTGARVFRKESRTNRT